MTISNLAHAFQNRYAFALKMMGAYLFFSALFFVGRASKPVLGELADVLMMTSFLWPYPLMLALQHWAPSPGMSVFIPVFFGGLLVILFFGIYIQRRFP